MVGKSTCGSGATGSTMKATAPAMATAMVSSVVATGRWMNGAEMLMRSPCRMRLVACASLGRDAAGDALAKPVEEDVDDRRGVEGEELAEQQPADHGDAQRPAQFRAQARADRQRNAAQQRGHGGHHDGTETQQAGLVDRLGRILAVLALGLQREVHDQNSVLLHDADEQDDADDGDDAQILAEKHQRQQRAHAGRRQRGKNGDRDG